MAHKMEDIPRVLCSALKKEPEKVFLLELEQELIDFIQSSLEDNGRRQIEIGQKRLKNSYYRLLAHQLCHYYHLSHFNGRMNDLVVSLRKDGFDYESFAELLESNHEADFVRLADFVRSRSEKDSWRPGKLLKAEQRSGKAAKPKVLIKRGDVSVTSDATQTRNTSSSSTKDEDVSLSSSEVMSPYTPEFSTPVSDVESERVSREAAYLKVREQVFSEDQDEVQEDEQNEEQNKGQNEEDATGSKQEGDFRNINGPINVPNGPSDFYSDAYHPSVYPQGFSQVPGYFPYFYTPPSVMNPVSGSIPMHPNYFVHPANFPGPGEFMPPPQASPYYPAFYPMPPSILPVGTPSHPCVYDKETERKILNNPYIISPRAAKDRRHKHYKKHYPVKNGSTYAKNKSDSHE